MRILLPLDGSLYGKKAVEFLVKSDKLRNNTHSVYLLNVQKKLPPPIEHKLKNAVVEEMYDSETKAVLKPAKKKLEEAGYKVKTKVAYGRATDHIVKTAKSIKASLIIMGSHGRTPVNGVLFGSKTSSVLASVKTPMLIIREETKPITGKFKVGVCIDGSPFSAAAVKYVEENLKLFGKDPVIYLINVIASTDPVNVTHHGTPVLTKEDYELASKVPMEPIYERLRGEDIETKVVLLKGDPAQEIADYATQNELGLLVLGTHGRNAFQAMMLGSTAMRIGASCQLPLLLIHRTEKKDKEQEPVEETVPELEEQPVSEAMEETVEEVAEEVVEETSEKTNS